MSGYGAKRAPLSMWQGRGIMLERIALGAIVFMVGMVVLLVFEPRQIDMHGFSTPDPRRMFEPLPRMPTFRP